MLKPGLESSVIPPLEFATQVYNSNGYFVPKPRVGMLSFSFFSINLYSLKISNNHKICLSQVNKYTFLTLNTYSLTSPNQMRFKTGYSIKNNNCVCVGNSTWLFIIIKPEFEC